MTVPHTPPRDQRRWFQWSGAPGAPLVPMMGGPSASGMPAPAQCFPLPWMCDRVDARLEQLWAAQQRIVDRAVFTILNELYPVTYDNVPIPWGVGGALPSGAAQCLADLAGLVRARTVQVFAALDYQAALRNYTT